MLLNGISQFLKSPYCMIPTFWNLGTLYFSLNFLLT